MEKSIFSLKNVGKVYSAKAEPVLEDFNLEIYPGEKVVLLGPNGVGKTTLLKLLTHYQRPTSGTIQFLGEEFSKDPYQYNSLVSWVDSSDQGLFERLTGRENILFFTNLIKMAPGEVESRIKDWSELKAFVDALETPFYQCSVGMQQLLKIFVLSLHNPKIYIWDEPFKNLDEKVSQFLIDKFWKIPDFTMVISTHKGLDQLGHIDKKICLER